MNNKNCFLVTLILCMQTTISFCMDDKYQKIPFVHKENRGLFYHNKFDEILFKDLKENAPEKFYTDGTNHLIFIYPDSNCPYNEQDKGFTKNDESNIATVSFENVKFRNKNYQEIPLSDLEITPGTQTPHHFSDFGDKDNKIISAKVQEEIARVAVNNRNEISGLSKIFIVAGVCYVAYKASDIFYAARLWWSGKPKDGSTSE